MQPQRSCCGHRSSTDIDCISLPLSLLRFQVVLSSLCRLCSTCKGADERIVKAVVTVLASGDVPLFSETSRTVLETLAGIASSR